MKIITQSKFNDIYEIETKDGVGLRIEVNKAQYGKNVMFSGKMDKKYQRHMKRLSTYLRYFIVLKDIPDNKGTILLKKDHIYVKMSNHQFVTLSLQPSKHLYKFHVLSNLHGSSMPFATYHEFQHITDSLKQIQALYD